MGFGLTPDSWKTSRELIMPLLKSHHIWNCTCLFRNMLCQFLCFSEHCSLATGSFLQFFFFFFHSIPGTVTPCGVNLPKPLNTECKQMSLFGGGQSITLLDVWNESMKIWLAIQELFGSLMPFNYPGSFHKSEKDVQTRWHRQNLSCVIQGADIVSKHSWMLKKEQGNNSWTSFLRAIMLALAVQPAPAGALAFFLLEIMRGFQMGSDILNFLCVCVCSVSLLGVETRLEVHWGSL